MSPNGEKTAAGVYMTEDERSAAYQSEAKNLAIIYGKISDLCKYVWIGSIATFFALLTAQKDSRAFEFYTAHRGIVFAAAIAGSLAVLFDYLQSLAALAHANRVTRWLEASDQVDILEFNKIIASCWSRLNRSFFYVKNLSAVLSAILMITAMWLFFSR